MKSIRVTIRLTPYQLARGLQTIRQLKPDYKLISINDLVKTIYQIYLTKDIMNKSDEVPTSLLEEILSFSNKSAEKQITLQDLLNIKN